MGHDALKYWAFEIGRSMNHAESPDPPDPKLPPLRGLEIPRVRFSLRRKDGQ